MNYTHFDTLIAHLQNLLVTAPERFDYDAPLGSGDDGCVDCHCRLLGGYAFKEFMHWPGGMAIMRFLDCSKDEAMDLFAPSAYRMFKAGVRTARHGADGIREALRRLAILATRYPRPDADPVPSRDAIEKQFLATLRAECPRPRQEATTRG